MAVNYTTFQVQLGAALRISQSLRAFWTYATQASNANHYRRLLSAASGFGQSDTEEARAYGDYLDYFDNQLENAVAAQWTAHRSVLSSGDNLFGILRVDLPASAELEESGAIDYDYEDVNGVISIVARNGVLGALRKDMLTNTQHVLANGISFGSFTADNGNRGALTATSMTGLSHTLTGTLVFEVTNESVTAPKLSVQLQLTPPLPDGTITVDGDNELQPEKAWEDGPTGLTITLTRSGLAAPIEGGDGGAMFSVSSFTNPKDGDMAGGILYVRVVRQAVAPIWLIEFYNSSARTVKVGSITTDTTAGTFALDITLKNNTRFVSTFDRAAANTALPAAGNSDDDITFDIDQPRLGDRWTRTVTSDDAGNFSTKLAHLFRASLPTNAAPSFTDANASSISVS